MDRFFQFEHRRDSLAPGGIFLRRLGVNLLVALGVLAVSLAIGMAGYMGFEGKKFVDAYDSAAMILAGMGPFGQANTLGGRLFEGTYALFSGIVVVVVASIILAPVFHRVLHTFHVEDDADENREEGPAASREARGVPAGRT